ncbi:MAG: DsbA family protein [Burkholderiales bacterium]
MSQPNRVLIDFFGDYICPFCYLTVPVLYQAKAELGDSIELRWRGLELRPEPMTQLDPTGPDYLRQWNEQLLPIAAERGITPHLPTVLPRSRQAMEAVAFARDEGAFDAMHQALYRAFFVDGCDLGSIDELVRIGRRDAGLDGNKLRAALDSGEYVARVQADRLEAAFFGVAGLPVLVLRREDQEKKQSQALWGAQPLKGVLEGVRTVRAGR